MKKALMAMLLGVTLSVLTAGLSLAEDVYVTKNGKKYHHSESRFIKGKEVEKISLEEALARGLEPSKDYLKWKEAQDKDPEVSNKK